jgi:hypothetical protein
MPVSALNARAKLRSLMHARAASAGTGQVVGEVVGHPRLELAQRSRAALWAASWALNCAWPPGRLTNSTSQRATSSATRGPRSSSTSASARSMPAVTPADVRTGPSTTKIGSRSTATAGWRRCRSSQYCQWVVARRPSSSPALASTYAPVQTDATRRARAASAPTRATTSSDA